MKTTLNQIKALKPCTDGWKKLLRSLDKNQADNEPLSIIKVLESNGLDDALWCLRAVTGHDREIRLYAVWCARQVQHLMTDPGSIAALDVAERFDYLVDETGKVQFIEAGPPFGLGAHPCAFVENRVQSKKSEDVKNGSDTSISVQGVCLGQGKTPLPLADFLVLTKNPTRKP